MFFYAILAVLVVSAEAFNSCDRSRYNAADSTFHRLSNTIIDLDKKVQDTCKQFPTFAAREIFGGNSYRLEVLLPEFGQATFEVRLKHRVIYIVGHHPRVGKTCDLTYVDIKVLPDFVTTHAGAWTYKDGLLVVAFPYAYRLEEHSLYCSNSYIDETVVHLRRGFPNEQIFLDN